MSTIQTNNFHITIMKNQAMQACTSLHCQANDRYKYFLKTQASSVRLADVSAGPRCFSEFYIVAKFGKQTTGTYRQQFWSCPLIILADTIKGIEYKHKK